jgi:hypothetical protein
MSFDPGSLFASCVIGSVGLALFLYGKRAQRWPQMVVGVVLLVYPYFVASVAVMVAIAAGLLGVLWLATKRLGM